MGLGDIASPFIASLGAALTAGLLGAASVLVGALLVDLGASTATIIITFKM